jgi:hypothetical protein
LLNTPANNREQLIQIELSIHARAASAAQKIRQGYR